jgi:hypothetical protein
MQGQGSFCSDFFSSCSLTEQVWALTSEQSVGATKQGQLLTCKMRDKGWS